MFKTLYRILIYLFSKIIKTDEISEKYPVSLKALIIDNNKILLLKNERNEWDFPGGKINSHEYPEECLKREVKEELNLSINNLNILKALNIEINEVPVMILLYNANICCDSSINISYEHLEFNFFSKSEILNLNMHSAYKQYIDEHLNIS